jgi:hypothetical protein
MGVPSVDQIVEPRRRSSAVRPRRGFTNFWWTTAAEAVDSHLGGVFTFTLWGQYRLPAAGEMTALDWSSYDE